MGAGLLGTAGAVLQVVKLHLPKLDPFGDDQEEHEPPTGWCKVVPRFLRSFATVDALGLLLLAKSATATCDVPLKAWLVGGLLLGFPVSQLVQRVAKRRPNYRFYRLTVLQLRDGGDPRHAQLDGLVFYDQFNLPIDRAYVQEQQDGAIWSAALNRGEAELVTGYRLVTHRSAAPAHDPVSWVLEGSADGVVWHFLDEVDMQQVPRERGVPTAKLDDLAHLEEATSAFRNAFLLEVAATAVAFAWLVTGTTWVGQGSETCVDSAPFLWYCCYFAVVLAWSFLGTVTIGLIISAVAMVLLGVKSSRN